jgi:farnesyl-diphosphate farnesyltransferase
MIEPNAMDILAETSRTFFIPISGLLPGLQEAVASAYLCMRAIDEIEDHAELPAPLKVELLRRISEILKHSSACEELPFLFQAQGTSLPEVTVRLADWAKLSPPPIAPRVWEATSAMAERMADWVEKNWTIRTEEDLDGYTYCVAGAVGELLSDIWLWYDGTETDGREAVGFGRGLQAVNIIRNRAEDLERGVDFFPDRWSRDDMLAYTRRNLSLGDAYIRKLKRGPVYDFCSIPLALAHGTLQALEAGEQKLSRTHVTEIVKRLQADDS